MTGLRNNMAPHDVGNRRVAAPAGPLGVPLGELPSHRFQVWEGVSGTRYLHTIHALITCPPLPEANIVLARRDASGRAVALDVMRTDSDVPTLNLAKLRQRGASLGATEVHLYMMAGGPQARGIVESDVRRAIATGGHAPEAANDR